MTLTILPVWRAGAPRFLMLALGCWILARLAAYGLADAPMPLNVPASLQPAYPPPVPFHGDEAVSVRPAMGAWTAAARPGSAPLARPVPVSAPLLGSATRSAAELDPSPLPVVAAPLSHAPSGAGHADRHYWRLALLGRLAPQSSRPLAAAALARPGRAALFPPAIGLPAPVPRWPDQTDRWSLAFASYWRSGGGAPPSFVRTSGPMLGGSQTALRIDHGFGPARRLRAYARLTDTPGRGGPSDIGVGVAVRPLRAVPLDIHAERRFAVGTGSVDTTLVYAAGGVDDRRLPHDFRLSAYAQAGVADYGRTTVFVDTVAVAQRQVADHRGLRLSLGSMMAASVQSGAHRIDVGPRAALAVPGIGKGAAVTLDWRERVGGNARPASGVALTIAADF